MNFKSYNKKPLKDTTNITYFFGFAQNNHQIPIKNGKIKIKNFTFIVNKFST